MARSGWTDEDQQAFEALANRLVQRAADPDERYPQGGLTAADRALLVDGFDRDEIAADDLIRRWAQAIGGRPDIRGVEPSHRSLHGFRKKGAANRRARQAAEEGALAVAEAAMRRRNRASARTVPEATLDPDQMINSQSVQLMAAGFLLRERRGRLWYDDFHRSIRLDWDGGPNVAVVPPYEINDAAILRLMVWLRSIDRRLGDASNTSLEDAIKWAADTDHRNEPADWLRSLAWDGIERLPNVMHRIFKAPQTALNREIGRNLFIGIAARILKPGCKLDTMVVLRGGQGLNKSTACEVIGGKWYAQSHASVDSKDFVQELRGLMVLEVAELHSFVATRSGSARVKAMLSVREDRYRPVWGRTVQTFPRTLVVIGSTNDYTFHNDPTGGRRLQIVDTPHLIDIGLLRAEREQLFAEAVHLFKTGATWWEFPEEEHRAMVESATTVNYFQEELEEKLQGEDIYDGVARLVEEIEGGIRRPALEPVAPSIEETGPGVPAIWGTLLTLHRVAHWLKLSPRDVESGLVRNRLTEALRGMGFEHYRLKVATDRRVIRVWLKDRPLGLHVKRAEIRGDQGDMPF